MSNKNCNCEISESMLSDISALPCEMPKEKTIGVIAIDSNFLSKHSFSVPLINFKRKVGSYKENRTLNSRAKRRKRERKRKK